MELDRAYYYPFNRKLPIPDKVKQFALLQHDCRNRFVATIEKEPSMNVIIERVFGIRRTKTKKKIEVEEVLRLRDDFNGCFCRNLHLTFCGYCTIWKNTKCHSYYYNDEYQPEQRFEKCRVDYPNLPLINLFTLEDVIAIKPEYKYCCWDGYGFVTEYLQRYKKEPYIEMLQKLKLGWYANKKQIVSKLQDKAFRKFLFKEAGAIRENQLDVHQIIKMFKKNMTVEQVVEEKGIKLLKRNNQNFFKEYPMLDPIKVYRYLEKQKVGFCMYEDLIKAVSFLKLDLNDTKNSYPHEFMKYHDLYTEQMESVKNKDIDERIRKVSQKYHKYLKTYDDITMVFPNNTADFINEGKELHHCVGRMGYNKKMANGESLIIFIRHTEEINKPFLTLELEPNKKKILQFYGDHDDIPPKEINNLIRTQWLNDISKIRIKGDVVNA